MPGIERRTVPTLHDVLRLLEFRTKIVSLSSFLIGSAYALCVSGRLSWPRFALMAVATVCVDLGTAGFNSYYDFRYGVDRADTDAERYKVLVQHDIDPRIAFRLAYHLDHALNDQVSVFHNMEILPAFEDPGDYNMTTDAGIRAKLTKDFFSEFKVEWKRDTTPAPGADKNDLRYVLGIGWLF